MTKEEKQLLLKDLCARLPYGVKVMNKYKSQTKTLSAVDIKNLVVRFYENDVNAPFGTHVENPLKLYLQIKPYLRPISSMTEEESFDFGEVILNATIEEVDKIDWLNEHHFDYRGLIEKGLALEAPEGMYKEK